MVKGNAHVIDMQHEVRAQRWEFRQARVRFKTAAKIITDVTRKPTLKRRQTRQFRQAIAAEYLIQYRKRRFIVRNAIQQGLSILDFQG
jgi:hypothetical protein